MVAKLVWNVARKGWAVAALKVDKKTSGCSLARSVSTLACRDRSRFNAAVRTWLDDSFAAIYFVMDRF